ncbi:MAG: hypothetical protein J5748_04545 [Bacteroidales bacterium]|nr:hypothetical protein [Bacteroidales bacterium]
MKKILFIAVLALLSFNAFAQELKFADPEVLRCALKAGDRNGDGVLSKVEADSLTVLNLTVYRSHIFEVKTYEDLQKFPNLKKVWLGESDIQDVDLSANYKLEFVAVQSPLLKTLVLAVGCYPQLVTPNSEGSLTVKRVYNDNDPNSIWYR